MRRPTTLRISHALSALGHLASAAACSNRSAALLQLKKLGKALEDAEQCIKRRPDWDKGFYRKGLALEIAERCPEVTSLIAASPYIPMPPPARLHIPLYIPAAKAEVVPRPWKQSRRRWLAALAM